VQWRGGSQSLRENRRAAGEIEEKSEARREKRGISREISERSEIEERNKESREALEK